jgi:hypothetical protein
MAGSGRIPVAGLTLGSMAWDWYAAISDPPPELPSSTTRSAPACSRSQRTPTPISASFWRTYAKRRGELIGIFQAAMIEGRFRDRWLELRSEAITRIAAAIRAAQAEGYCPGVDPVLTASALSAMLEHFCYIWLGQGGEKDVPFDDERALDALCTIWVKAVYWRDEGPSAPSSAGAGPGAWRSGAGTG